MLNHGAEPIELEVRLDAAADFADLFEVKDALAKKGRYYQRVERAAGSSSGIGASGSSARRGSPRPRSSESTRAASRSARTIEPQGEWRPAWRWSRPWTASGESRVRTKYGHGDDEAGRTWG